ncbi:hypothetical protein DENSPDRAFT_885368 [Dentipellis sp. KUC8613]|nr:hypothetical protein DENSPDRAFT_885368 [Dentipellis sp. KUC8613]
MLEPPAHLPALGLSPIPAQFSAEGDDDLTLLRGFHPSAEFRLWQNLRDDFSDRHVPRLHVMAPSTTSAAKALWTFFHAFANGLDLPTRQVWEAGVEIDNFVYPSLMAGPPHVDMYVFKLFCPLIFAEVFIEAKVSVTESYVPSGLHYWMKYRLEVIITGRWQTTTSVLWSSYQNNSSALWKLATALITSALQPAFSALLCTGS